MFSQGLSQLTGLILGVVLVRMVDPATFGTYRQGFLIYTLLAGVLSIQIEASLYYFVPRLGAEQKRPLLLQSLALTFGFATLIAGAMFAGADTLAGWFDNPEVAGAVRALALYPFCERILLMLPAFMISEDRAVRAGVYSVAASIARVSSTLLAFYLSASIVEVMWAVVGSCAVVAALGCLDMLRISPRSAWRIDRELVREQLAYTWPLWAIAVAGILNTQIGSFLISAFFDPETFAVYSCGAIDLPVVGLITTSLTSAMMPNLVTLVNRGERRDALHIWQEGVRKSSWVIFPCFCFFSVVSFDFMVMLYGESYRMAAWPFAIYLLRLPVRVAVHATLLRATGLTRPVAIGALLSLAINVTLSTALLYLGEGTRLGFVAPAIGTVCASFITMGYLLSRVSRAMGVSTSAVMRWRELGGTMLLGILAGAVVLVVPLPDWPLMATLVFRGFVFVAAFVTFTWWSGTLQEDEYEMILLPWKTVTHFLRR
jgi:O-antigen/teichoic acid export membrane protein